MTKFISKNILKKMKNKTVSVIIVAAGRRDYLKSLLDSLKQQSYPFLEIIVIDNSPAQNLAGVCEKNYPEVKFYFNQKNSFYGVSLNKGIDISTGNFILCLNDDVVLDRGFIKEALRGFDIQKNIGMVSGKVLRFDRKTLDSTGLFLSPFRTAKERGYGIKDTGQFDKEGFIFGVNGGVAFYSRLMLEQIKLNTEYFDSDFRFFYEDLDISWRAHNFGWGGYYIPTAIAYHVRGGTARENQGINKRFARRYISNELHFDLVKNRYLAIIKNENLLDLLIFLPYILIYEILAWLYIIFFKPAVLNLFFGKKVPLSNSFKKRLHIKANLVSFKEKKL